MLTVYRCLKLVNKHSGCSRRGQQSTAGEAQCSQGEARRASQKRQGWNSSHQGGQEKAGTSGVGRECSYHLKALVAQSCSTLCDPMNCSPPGSSVHGILQARILEWVAIPSSGDLPDPGIKPRSPTLQADSLPSEPPWKAHIS